MMAVAMQTVPKRSLSEDDFMRLADDGHKYELVDGEAKEVPTNIEHDTIGFNLLMLIGPHTRGRGFVTTGQAGFRMISANVRCPDVSFTRKARFPGGKPPTTFGSVAPDLCVEIISPSEDMADMNRKVREYFASGAEQVWHIFPEAQTMTIYTSPATSAQYSAGDTIEGGDLLPGFRCQVADLFVVE